MGQVERSFDCLLSKKGDTIDAFQKEYNRSDFFSWQLTLDSSLLICCQNEHIESFINVHNLALSDELCLIHTTNIYLKDRSINWYIRLIDTNVYGISLSKSGSTKNIILYFGNDHILNYTKMLKLIGFKLF